MAIYERLFEKTKWNGRKRNGLLYCLLVTKIFSSENIFCAISFYFSWLQTRHSVASRGVVPHFSLSQTWEMKAWRSTGRIAQHATLPQYWQCVHLIVVFYFLCCSCNNFFCCSRNTHTSSVLHKVRTRSVASEVRCPILPGKEPRTVQRSGHTCGIYFILFPTTSCWRVFGNALLRRMKSLPSQAAVVLLLQAFESCCLSVWIIQQWRGGITYMQNSGVWIGSKFPPIPSSIFLAKAEKGSSETERYWKHSLRFVGDYLVCVMQGRRGGTKMFWSYSKAMVEGWNSLSRLQGKVWSSFWI